MKFSALIASVALALSSGSFAQAAKSFSASNLFYAAGLTETQQTTLFEGLQSAGVKVLRVWLDSQGDSPKGTPIDGYGSLEYPEPGDWDDTVLERLDDIMVKAHGYGIKLLICIHSYNVLDAQSDVYGQWYGTGDFYTDENAVQYFKNRISHVMAHVNPHNGKKWSESSEYIFAFEAQNEAMHGEENDGTLQKWQCDMANVIKDGLNWNTDILVTNGGGAWLANSMHDEYFSCDALDVLSIHAYGSGDYKVSMLEPYVEKAKGTGKMLIMEEWGACYTDVLNNECDGGSPLAVATRDSNIKKWAKAITNSGIPWFYWQILPNPDPHEGWDYEVGIDDVNWEALKAAGLAAGKAEAAFDFSPWLL